MYCEKVGYGVPLILKNNIDGVHTAILYDADLGGLSHIYQYNENDDNPECMIVDIDMSEVAAIIKATFKYGVYPLEPPPNPFIIKKIKAAKKTSGLTYTELADKMDVNKVWLASAFEHQQYVPKEYCVKLAEALGLKEEDTMFLSEVPYDNQKNVTPVFCRLPEVFETYESAIKSIIHEQGGNAVMSSTSFNIDVNVTTDEEGNHHIRIEFDERRFPHAKQGKYPWK